MWPSHAPQAYCFESGLWQASTVCKMALDRRGIDIRPLTPEATLKRMGLSFLLPRSGEMRPVQLSGLPLPDAEADAAPSLQRAGSALGHAAPHAQTTCRARRISPHPEGRTPVDWYVNGAWNKWRLVSPGPPFPFRPNDA